MMEVDGILDETGFEEDKHRPLVVSEDYQIERDELFSILA